MVDEVLDILLDNATRHGAGVVRLVVREFEGWLAIDIGDEGPGFDADPEDAFTRREGGSSGHGIGLALARSLAHAEGGRLTVTRAERAPVVTLFLPTPAAPATLASRPEDEHVRTDIAAPTRRNR